MHLVMPVLRTVFFVFIVGFTARALPLYWQVPKTFDEQYARCSSALGVLQQASWLAVAWILVEVVVGWAAARRRAGAARAEQAAGPGPGAR
jgi:hypothetical protein